MHLVFVRADRIVLSADESDGRFWARGRALRARARIVGRRGGLSGALHVDPLVQVLSAILRRTAEQELQDELDEEVEEKPVVPLTRRASDVIEEKTSWIWQDRVPIGYITAVFGPRTSGKSFVAIDMAAHVTRGLSWSDEPAGAKEAGSVLMIATEDQISSMVVPRLRAAGADLAKVEFLDYPNIKAGNGGSFVLSEIDRWEKAIDRIPDLRIIIVDPFAALMGTAIDRHTNELIKILNRLASLAQERKVAIVLVNATDKVSAGKNWRHGMDVLPFLRATARTVWTVETDHVDPDRRLFLPAQVTLTADPGGLAFRIDGAARIAWEEEPVAINPNGPAMSARALSDVARAVAWLTGFLAEGARRADEVLRQATIEGLSRRALYAAKQRLGVASRKDKGDFVGGWSWEMPARGIEDVQPRMHADKDGRETDGKSRRRGSCVDEGSCEDSKIPGAETVVRSHANERTIRAVTREDSKMTARETRPPVQNPEMPAHLVALSERMVDSGMPPIVWNGPEGSKISGSSDKLPQWMLGTPPAAPCTDGG